MTPEPMLVVAAVIERDGRFLVTLRPAAAHLGGIWEFPGGKLAPGESHEVGLRREIREELDVDVAVHDLMLSTTHAYADRTVCLFFYRCTPAGEPRPALGQEMRWVARFELTSLPFPPADDALIGLLTQTSSPQQPR